MHERASSWSTPVLDGCSSANFTFIATCTWTKLVRDETLLLADRCPAVLLGVLSALRLCARSQLSDQTALVPSHINFTRSQAGLYSLSDSYYRRHSFPGRPRRHVRTYVRTYAGTHVRTYARTHARTHARNCSTHHDSLGLAQARPNYYISTSSIARFTRFSYCGRGFCRSACFTSYGNPVSVHH